MIRRYTISPPMPRLPGDTFDVVGGVLEQRRGGSLVAFRNLAAMDSAPLAGPEVVGNTVATFFQEVGFKMLKTLTSISNPTPPATGPYIVNYADGSSREYSNVAALQAESELVSADLLERLLVARYIAMRPAVNDPSYINGTSLEIDLESALSPFVFAQG